MRQNWNWMLHHCFKQDKDCMWYRILVISRMSKAKRSTMRRKDATITFICNFPNKSSTMIILPSTDPGGRYRKRATKLNNQQSLTNEISSQTSPISYIRKYMNSITDTFNFVWHILSILDSSLILNKSDARIWTYSGKMISINFEDHEKISFLVVSFHS